MLSSRVGDTSNTKLKVSMLKQRKQLQKIVQSNNQGSQDFDMIRLQKLQNCIGIQCRAEQRKAFGLLRFRPTLNPSLLGKLSEIVQYKDIKALYLAFFSWKQVIASEDSISQVSQAHTKLSIFNSSIQDDRH
jgi:hypothetical protein